MQNGLGHDHTSQHGTFNDDDISTTPGSTRTPPSDTSQYRHLSRDKLNNDEAFINGPPTKKRKISGFITQQSSSSRPPSPPWKKIAVEGPTSFVEGGRRKSSRTNAIPLELQPPSDKRQTRATNQYTVITKNVSIGAQTPKTLPSNHVSRHTQVIGKTSKSIGNYAAQDAKDLTLNLQPPNGVAPNLDHSSIAPGKRSYKKTHLATSVSLPRSLKPPLPTSTPPKRKVGRPSKAEKAARELEARTIITNGWHTSNGEDVGRLAKSEHHGFGTHDGEDEVEEPEENDGDNDYGTQVDPNFKPQRLKFKVRMPTVTVQQPGHVVLARKFASFRDWVQNDDPFTGDETAHLTKKQVREEAQMRLRIVQAAEPGGILNPEKCSVYVPDPQDDPPQQYSHQDHLVAHAIYFRKLMNKEHREHIMAAKKLAHAAMAMWKRSQPRTTEEVEQERYDVVKTRKAQLMQDLTKRWELAEEEVNKQRLEKWEEEQQALGKQALNRVLEQSTKLLHKRRRRESAGSDIAEDQSEDASNQSDRTSGKEDDSSIDSHLDSEDEDNMSSSQTESEESSRRSIANDDEILTVDQLREKYAEMPTGNLDRPPDSDEREPLTTTLLPAGISNSIRRTPPSYHTDGPQTVEQQAHTNNQDSPSIDLDNLDEDMLDDNDESTDMQDDMGDSDEQSDGSEDDDDSAGSQEDQGLLGFFAKEDFHVPKGVLDDTLDKPPCHDDIAFEEEVEEVSLIPDAAQVQTPSASNSEAPSFDVRKEHSDKGTNVSLGPSSPVEQQVRCLDSKPPLSLSKSSPLAKLAHVETMVDTEQGSLPVTPISSQPLKTQVPSLLRGTLREYQHYGLDWLAGLYANGTNGILADEMGLGKTIQTISLLAHLAVEHEVWGPHLIVVPTSVMLNWEMEFKKFLPGFKILTYYGTQGERKQKRKGWLDDDKWHVCITSYQLVLQDQATFKKRGWHYLVLDEAHNIKNFRSQRWQTLLTFRTRARLLLTGTPLQNNLTELWSLMFFLMPSDSTDTGIAGFADLQAFTSWFKKPVDQILEQGRETMDDEAKEIVRRLHGVLRPYLLRRLKADVEKQMPAKYEHVMYCKLSKRQRYLYDGFMSRAQTKETLASGNYLSIINCLMQLRKVCNHPDLFETRQIVTSFAMPKSAIADYEIKELLVRRRLLQSDSWRKVNLDVVNLLPGANGPVSALDTIQNSRLGALGRLRQLETQQQGRMLSNLQFDGTSVATSLTCIENSARSSTLERLRQHAYLTSLRSQRRPLYSHSVIERLKMDVVQLPSQPSSDRRSKLSDWFTSLSPAMEDMVLTLPRRSEKMENIVRKFACVTPVVVAPDLTTLALSRPGIEVVREAQRAYPIDSFHEARMHLSIAFPDKRLLQYDCGKLQRLDALLRELQVGGHRALIFTQMTKVLDILEQFLNIHGHKYLRLDGATKIEQRQILTDRFNNDDRILAFILSSRSGGLGINLTGADTVIFYDLDWNPAMDKQCQDRCHRIGQTRDVHIYRFVSEYTIEANILRKANQKRMLDDVIIQEGDFTTDYFYKADLKDAVHDDEASAAMDRVLGAGAGHGRLQGQIFEHAEDKEDIAAAKVAEKEMVQTDDADFDEKTGNATPRSVDRPTTPGDVSLQRPSASSTTQRPDAILAPEALMNDTTAEAIEEVEPGSVDDYILAHVRWELRDEPVVLPVEKRAKKAKKGGEHIVKRPR